MHLDILPLLFKALVLRPYSSLLIDTDEIASLLLL